MIATVEIVNKTTESVKLITDETQVVISDVKGFVGGIKTKVNDLENVMVNDVKGVLDEIRAILDQVPKMPEMPQMNETIYDQFNITDYIPGMSSPREDPPQPPVISAPQNAQVYPEKDMKLNSTIAANAKG